MGTYFLEKCHLEAICLEKMKFRKDTKGSTFIPMRALMSIVVAGVIVALAYAGFQQMEK